MVQLVRIFVRLFLDFKAKAESHETLKVISDQVSCPTSSDSLALACWRSIQLNGIAEKESKLHWSDAGVASWYDFAIAIGEISLEIGLLQKAAIVKPIPSNQYPIIARRPSFSLLDCKSTIEMLKLEPDHWRYALRKVLIKIKEKKIIYNDINS